MPRLGFFIILRPYSTSVTSTVSKSPAKASKFVAYCNDQITSLGRNGKIREAESLFRRIPDKSVVTYTAMLTAYGNNGQITHARTVFDEMPQRTVVTWNAMITAYARNMNRVNGVDEAFRLFIKMPERNQLSHTAMIMCFVNAGRFKDAERFFESIPLEWRDPFSSNVLMNGYLKIGKLEGAVKVFEGMVKKNAVSWSSMVDGYCKNGRLREARKLFDSMEGYRDQFTWCSMIDGYMEVGCFKDGFRLFSQMRRESQAGVGPATLSVIFSACGRMGGFREGLQVHGLVSKLGFSFDVILGNSVITMYSRFGYINEARILFDMMSEKDVVSWNSLIYAYAQAGRIEEAAEIFEKMDSKDSVTWTTLITGFYINGLIEECVELFCKMRERDDVAWTALISGFVYNGEHEEAIRWFVKMMRDAVRPNPLTLSSLLSGSANLAVLSIGLQMHAFVVKTNLGCDVSVQNSLVSMYSKCGDVNNASKIFESITSPNIVSFNSMITGLSHNGFGEEALGLFRELIGRGQDPTGVTFLGVLSACSHAGLVEEGRRYFKSMTTFFNVEPGVDHYASMVDLLGRGGLLDEAMKLIASMPVEPHAGVWGALLGASRTHMRLDIAKVAAQNMLELEPDNATPYVVLSDTYRIAGKRRDEEEMRLCKRLRGVRKSPGCSWITVKEKVKVFLSGEISHEDFQEITPVLWTIMYEMMQLDSTDIE